MNEKEDRRHETGVYDRTEGVEETQKRVYSKRVTPSGTGESKFNVQWGLGRYEIARDIVNGRKSYNT